MLGLGLSVTSDSGLIEWRPSMETSCLGWWPTNGTYTLNESAVAGWEDDSGSGNHLIQEDEATQPSGVSGGAVTFDGGTSNQHLDMTTQLTLVGPMTIGILLNAQDTTNRIIFGDDDTANNWIRISTESVMQFKFNTSGSKSLTLDVGTTFGGQQYLVITKDSSDVLRMYVDGVLQENTISIGIDGDLLLDNMGIRDGGANEYGGTISEAMIFRTQDDALTDNIHTRLAAL